MLKMIKQNKELKKFIREVRTLLHSARDPDDLYDLVGRFKTYDKPLEYINYFYYILLALLLCPLLYSIAIDHLFSSFLTDLFVLLGAAIFLYGYIRIREDVIDDLSKEVIYQKVLFDNQLKTVDCQDASFTRNLINRFDTFIVGNCDHKIEEYYSGRHEGRSYPFSYHYFKLHYAMRVRHSKTSYYRYGFILDFPYVSDLSISPHAILLKSIYKTESKLFNDYYLVSGRSKNLAAEFLKSSVITILENMHNEFSKISFEFNRDHQLCLSFNNADVLTSPISYDLKQPDEFLTELKKQLRPPKLEAILNNIELLLYHSKSIIDYDKYKL